VALPLVAWKLGFFGPKKHWFSPQMVLSFVDFKILDHLKNLHRFPLTWPVIFANWAKIIRKYHPIKAPKNELPRSLVKTLPACKKTKAPTLNTFLFTQITLGILTTRTTSFAFMMHQHQRASPQRP